MNKKILLSVLTLGIIISLAGYGVKNVLADDENNLSATIVARIAQKFNLKEEDVQAVFEAVRDERRAEMQKTREEKLSRAVSDGVITEAQKTALLTKMEEHKGERMQNREEMQKWFTEQGIDETKLRDYLGFGGQGKGPGMGRMGM